MQSFLLVVLMLVQCYIVEVKFFEVKQQHTIKRSCKFNCNKHNVTGSKNPTKYKKQDALSPKKDCMFNCNHHHDIKKNKPASHTNFMRQSKICKFNCSKGNRVFSGQKNEIHIKDLAKKSVQKNICKSNCSKHTSIEVFNTGDSKSHVKKSAKQSIHIHNNLCKSNCSKHHGVFNTVNSKSRVKEFTRQSIHLHDNLCKSNCSKHSGIRAFNIGNSKSHVQKSAKPAIHIQNSSCKPYCSKHNNNGMFNVGKNKIRRQSIPGIQNNTISLKNESNKHKIELLKNGKNNSNLGTNTGKSIIPDNGGDMKLNKLKNITLNSHKIKKSIANALSDMGAISQADVSALYMNPFHALHSAFSRLASKALPRTLKIIGDVADMLKSISRQEPGTILRQANLLYSKNKYFNKSLPHIYLAKHH